MWLELFKLTAAQGEATSTTLVAPGAVRPITPEAVVVRKVLAALEAARVETESVLTTRHVPTGTAMILVGVVVQAVSAMQHVKTIRDLNAGVDITGRPSATGVVLALLLAAVGLVMAWYLAVFR